MFYRIKSGSSDVERASHPSKCSSTIASESTSKLEKLSHIFNHTRLEMSAAGQNQAASKAVNTSNTSTPSSSFHSLISAEHSAQRRSGGSAALGTNSSSKALGTARNNQARKGQHKRQRKPRLLDDDEFSEAVGDPSSRREKSSDQEMYLIMCSLPSRPS